MSDRWAKWFSERRHGDDERTRVAIADRLVAMRDRVLENAAIEPGDVVVDIGTGDGLIALEALDRVGDDGVVIFDDISEDVLDICRSRAAGDPRCRFLNASVVDLPLEDDSVDVVTGAAVLIYVAEKQRAFDELYRVLRPAGRLSLYEPLNSFGYPEGSDTFWGFPVGDLEHLTEKVRDVWRSIELPEYASMHDWSERDLLGWVKRAGFSVLRYDATFVVSPSAPVEDFDARIRRAGNPLVPSIEEAIAQALTPEEAETLLAWLRPRMEAGGGLEHSAEGYLTAVK